MHKQHIGIASEAAHFLEGCPDGMARSTRCTAHRYGMDKEDLSLSTKCLHCPISAFRDADDRFGIIYPKMDIPGREVFF